MLKHRHLIIRSKIRKYPTAADLESMNTWFADLINSIGMKILSGPHTVYSEMVGNRGFTGVCVIETSHIALHTWDEDDPAIIQLDVYSCSELDINTVVEKLKRFDPSHIDYTFIDRDDGLKVLDQGNFTF